MKLAHPVVLALLLSLNLVSAAGKELDPEEEWMGIYSGENRVGYSYTLFKREKGALNIVEETNLRMNILGTDQNLKIKSDYFLDGYKLMAFDFSMSAPSVELKATGKRAGEEIMLEVFSVSGKSELSFPVGDEPLVMPVLYRWLSEQNPTVGRSYEVTLFDPTSILTGADSMSLRTTLRVEGEERVEVPLGSFNTYRVKTDFAGSEITAWVTDKGEVIKEVSPPGLAAMREARDGVRSQALSSLNIIEDTAISSDVPLDNPRNLKLLRVRVGGIESIEGLDLEDENRQFYKDGLIEVKVSDLSRVKAYSIPYSGGTYDVYLKPSNLIQSDSDEVLSLASEIVSGEENSLTAARKINHWVFNSLDKTPTISVPNALDVLKTRKGDCNEHATLFAALSRAAGIPAKIALGIVFLDGKFYYHAWNEVFVGEWVAVDPTFGQFPADASHIKFIEGDLGKSHQIIKLVGKIKLEIVEAS